MKTTKKKLMQKIELLEPESDEQRNRVVCSLIGHSIIQTTFFGYFYCGRCGDQVGDSLGSCYSAKHVVIVGHKCDVCVKNYNNCTLDGQAICSRPL